MLRLVIFVRDSIRSSEKSYVQAPKSSWYSKANYYVSKRYGITQVDYYRVITVLFHTLPEKGLDIFISPEVDKSTKQLFIRQLKIESLDILNQISFGNTTKDYNNDYPSQLFIINQLVRKYRPNQLKGSIRTLTRLGEGSINNILLPFFLKV